MRLLPNIRFGTEPYPEKVARRLRALNLAAWIAAAVASAFAIQQLASSVPGLWKVGTVNALAALILAPTPFFHRFGSRAAAFYFIGIVQVYFVLVISLLGTGTGMQSYYLVGTALGMLFFGTDRILYAAILGAVNASIVVALEVFVPYDTGLQPTQILFGNFVATAIVSSGLLLVIVSYALREAGRAEATAEREYERSERLLTNILPSPIAARLKGESSMVIADKYDEASILFADMAGFTAQASETAPDDLVQFLNRVFSDFDRLVERHGLEKIKTTGDAYMVVSGVPTARFDHTEALAFLALEMCEAATKWRDPRGRNVPVRIGIGSGPVVAGVVGTRKFFYDVWGDAVNVAARMETTGSAGKIQVSEDVYERLKDGFVLEARGAIEIKGKGRMPTWFLLGRKPAPVAQPSPRQGIAASG
jgi:adenylate cyclase